MQVINRPFLFFDGVCNLCNYCVKFVIKHDKKKVFLFASLQSKAGIAVLKKIQQNTPTVPDSVILQVGDKIYMKSDAVLHTALLLGGWFKMAMIFFLIPRFIRNFIYDTIARNRYTYWGKNDSCLLPSKELKERFAE